MKTPEPPASPSSTASARPASRAGRALHAMLAAVIALGSTYYGLCTLALLSYTVAFPPTTGVQLQRRVEAWLADEPYERHYSPVPRSQIDDELERAVVAAEDTRFFEHRGIDWIAIQEAIEDNRQRGQTWRGGSTITQQLAKNLFLTTHSTYVRKALELPLTYLTEALLSKERILELYVNVIEWGPGVYGADAAAQYHYGTSAAQLGRYRSAALAACIPDPLVRRPERMDTYARIILRRMWQLGPLSPYFEPSTAERPARRYAPADSTPPSARQTPSRASRPGRLRVAPADSHRLSIDTSRTPRR